MRHARASDQVIDTTGIYLLKVAASAATCDAAPGHATVVRVPMRPRRLCAVGAQNQRRGCLAGMELGTPVADREQLHREAHPGGNAPGRGGSDPARGGSAPWHAS